MVLEYTTCGIIHLASQRCHRRVALRVENMEKRSQNVSHIQLGLESLAQGFTDSRRTHARTGTLKSHSVAAAPLPLLTHFTLIVIASWSPSSSGKSNTSPPVLVFFAAGALDVSLPIARCATYAIITHASVHPYLSTQSSFHRSRSTTTPPQSSIRRAREWISFAIAPRRDVNLLSPYHPLTYLCLGLHRAFTLSYDHQRKPTRAHTSVTPTPRTLSPATTTTANARR
jgi:hypothetical protein